GSRMKRRLLIRSATGVCVAGFALAARSQANAKIVLGQSAAFSGPASALGEQFKKGALLHFDKVNARGGVGGRQIELVSLDDSYGKAGLEGVNRALKPLNLAPASLGTVERNTVDVDAAVKSILDGKPDAIVQISAYKSCAAFIRAARKAGFGGTFYNVSFVGT